MKTKTACIAALGFSALIQTPPALAENINGRNLFQQRCAMCHGADIKGTGPLARKSNPPTPDLIPRTLRENGVKVPPHAWTVKDFRDLNEYMTGVIAKSR